MTRAPTLAEVAEITPGYSIPGAVQHDPDGRYQLILPRHLDVGGRPFVFDPERHAQRMTLPDRADKYRVRPGDVLFVARGDRNRAVVVHSCPEDSVASASLYVLRVRGDVDPDYLAWLLNQEPAQMSISQVRTGAGTPLVQRTALEGLELHLPDLEQQHRIAAVGSLLLAELDLVDRLAAALTRRARIIGSRLTRNTRRNRD
jgi:hypothetical protein